MSLLNGVLGVLYMLGVITSLACLRAWRASENGVLGAFLKMACLACSRAWRPSENGVLGVLQKIACFKKMVCLKLLNCFLGAFDHGALVKCQF